MTEVIWEADGSDAAVAEVVASVIMRPGVKTLVLPGGRTPDPVYAALAARPLPWSEVKIMPSDERLVPLHDPASNRGHLMAAFAGTGARIEPLSEGMVLPPRFDFVWLGMGADGHVASLFPSADPDPFAPPAVIRVVPDPLPPEAPHARLTLTLAALAAADRIILVIRGEAKRALVASGAGDLPVARLLRAARDPISVFWSPA